jgi:hypothetical protein
VDDCGLQVRHGYLGRGVLHRQRFRAVTLR